MKIKNNEDLLAAVNQALTDHRVMALGDTVAAELDGGLVRCGVAAGSGESAIDLQFVLIGDTVYGYDDDAAPEWQMVGDTVDQIAGFLACDEES